MKNLYLFRLVLLIAIFALLSNINCKTEEKPGKVEEDIEKTLNKTVSDVKSKLNITDGDANSSNMVDKNAVFLCGGALVTVAIAFL